MKPSAAPQAGAQVDELKQTLDDGTKIWTKWVATSDGYDWEDAGDFVEMPVFEVKENKLEPAVLPEPIFDALVADAPALNLAADISQLVLDNYSILNPANLTVQGVAKLGAKYANKVGSKGQFKGSEALRGENKMKRDAAREAELNVDQARRLHDEMTKNAKAGIELSYDEILQIARQIKGGG